VTGEGRVRDGGNLRGEIWTILCRKGALVEASLGNKNLDASMRTKRRRNCLQEHTGSHNRKSKKA